MALRGLRRLLDRRGGSEDGAEDASGSESSGSLGEMSAEGAEGTATTLDDSGDYKPPTFWERRMQDLRHDPDADDDGKWDVQQDSDGDGIDDYSERWVHGTNPYKADSDGDGLSDAAEIEKGTNPTEIDTDGDLLVDSAEYAAGTDPTDPDTGDTGVLDGYKDPDDDGVVNLNEWAGGTHPRNPDSDGDGTTDAGQSISEFLDDRSADREALLRRKPEGPAPAETSSGPSYKIVNENSRYELINPDEHRSQWAVWDKKDDEVKWVESLPDGADVSLPGTWVEQGGQLNRVDYGVDNKDYNPAYRGDASDGAALPGSNRDDPAKTGHAGSSEAEGEPDASRGEPENDAWDPDRVDPDSLTFDIEAPEVPGSETDPNAILAGESTQDSGMGRGPVGSDPGGPGGTAPPAEDINPVGKDVDPTDFADIRRGDGNASTGSPADTSGPAGPAGTSRFGQDDSSTSGAGSGIDDLLTGAMPTGDADFGSGASGDSSNGGDGGDERGSLEGRGEGLDDETVSGGDSNDEWQTFEPDSDSDGESYHRGEDGGWYDSNNDAADDETSTLLDQAESNADSAGDADAGGGDGESSEGGDGGGDSPNFGGGRDLDRAGLLDELGRSSGGGTTGTEMKASSGPVESGRPAGKPPIVHAGAPSSPRSFEDPDTDSDGDGVSDAEERSDGTSPDNSDDYLDSDGDGVADHVERDEGTDPDDAEDYLIDGEPPPEGHDHETSDPGVDEEKHEEDDYEGSDSSEGLSTSVNPIDGGFVDRDDAEKALSGVGAPQNGAQPQPIDPNPWEDTIEEGTIVGEVATADDLAQPVPDEGQGGEHLRENTGVDAGASSGMFGTGAIDPTETEVQTEGPWQDTPSTPNLDAAHDESESTDSEELEQVELGIALEAEGGSEPMKLVTTGPNDTPLRPEDPPESPASDPVEPDDFETMDSSFDMDPDKALALGLEPEPEPPIELEPDLLTARQEADFDVDLG